MNLSTTSYSILSLLALRDWTSYELAQQMQRTLHFVWPRAERKIYDEPKRLVAAGFATSEQGAVGRRAKTTYSITPAGRVALRDWLGTPPQPASLEFEGMLRVLFADQGDVEQLRSSIETVKAQAIDARLRLAVLSEGVLENDGGAFPERMHVNALSIRFLIDHHDHLCNWADWALAETASWKDTVTPTESTRRRSRKVFDDAASAVVSSPTGRASGDGSGRPPGR